MTQSQDSDGVSVCSDATETLVIRNRDEGLLLPNNDDNDAQYSPDQKSVITATSTLTSTRDDSPAYGDPAHGEPAYPSMGAQMLLDLSLTLPAVMFTIYGILLTYHDGELFDTKPVSILKSASDYGPTIFPIAFAAVTENLFKAIAAWRLERGIDVLSLESLLRSRTVFSSIASPISLQAFSILNILIMVFWALSPLGGQATLRVVGMGSSTNDCQFWYLDVDSMLSYESFDESLLTPEQAQAISAFSAAISSPIQIKTAQRDIFGHVKIPTIEPYLVNGTAGQDGWYQVDDNNTKVMHSSLAGLPITPDGGLNQYSNYKFHLETSYMKTSCHLKDTPDVQADGWETYVASRRPIQPNQNYDEEHDNYDQSDKKTQNITFPTAFSNNRTLLIESPTRNNVYKQPRELILTSYSKRENVISNATCSLETIRVKVELVCNQGKCSTIRIRPVKVSSREAFSTVLDRKDGSDSSLGGSPSVFFMTFVNSLLSNLDPSPIQMYLINPSSPFDLPYEQSYIGSLGDEDFSRHFSQLLNTFWIVSVAPADALNIITLQEKQMSNPEMEQHSGYRQANGTKTLGIQMLKVNRSWLGILLVASLSMLLSALAAAILNSLRRGPDILDNPIRLMKDSPYIRVGSMTTSMENGTDYTRRMKRVRVCLGDVKSEEKLGYIAIGTMDQVVPLSKQDYTRLYG